MNRYSLIRALGVLALAALAACSDGAPTEVIAPPPPLVTERPNHVPPAFLYGDSVYTIATITCNGTRSGPSAAAISCSSPQGIAVGGRGMHVRPFTDSVAYGGGIFQFRLRFRNLLLNRMGTADGPTTDGLMAFVVDSFTTTGGSGAVSVENRDSTGTFSAGNQPYFFYDTIVAMNEETMARRWRLNVPSTVTAFQFKVYVSAPLLPIVVFDKDVGGNRDIWRVNLDGTDLVQLTTAAGTDMDPTVANGRVVWVSYRNANAELYSRALTGGGESRLTNSLVNETAPALSLDGTRLAYVSDVSSVGKIWIGTYGGTTLTNAAPVTGSLGNVIENGPAWDRSTQILYTTTAGATSDLYYYVPGNAAPTLYPVSSTTAADVEPAISHAGGQRVLWATTRDAGDTEVYLRNGNFTSAVTTRLGVDAQPTFLSDDKMLWVEEGSPTILRWRSISPVVNGTVPFGAGSARNPYGVPLYQ